MNRVHSRHQAGKFSNAANLLQAVVNAGNHRATGEASMPIPESVKVTFKNMKNYMDFRDVVHATQSQMLQQFGGENVFQGRIIEVHIGVKGVTGVKNDIVVAP